MSTKLCSLVLTLCLLMLNITSGIASEATVSTAESKRAHAYGLISEEVFEEDAGNEITAEDFCGLLESVIAREDASMLPEWGAFSRVADNAPISRQEAMMFTLLAGQLIGLNHANDYAAEKTVDFDIVSAKLVWASDANPDWDQEVYIDQHVHGRFENYIDGALFYALRQTSLSTQQPLFLKDAQNDLRPEQNLTIGEAVTAILNLYESTSEGAQQYMDYVRTTLDTHPEAAPIMQHIEGKKAQILDDERLLEKVAKKEYIAGENYHGTAYYISNAGDDNNNGKSPEKAIATIEKLNSLRLKAGDAVFFERGSTWYSASIHSKAGVTYTAYGEGDKPNLYGSPENGAGSEKWTLHSEGANGEKIWVFYRNMLDVGAIVLDNGLVYGDKVLAGWDGTQYRPLNDTQARFSIAEQLTEDLQFFSKSDSLLPEEGEIHLAGHTTANGEQLALATEGPLYLRCDEGNPGTLYGEIQFISPLPTFDGIQNGCVLDNLCIQYGRNGVATDRGSTAESAANTTIIQNCEIAWCGGVIMNYVPEESNARDVLYPKRAGGGIISGSSGCTIRNNYLHHHYQEAVSLEMIRTDDKAPGNMENNTVSGNIIEFSQQALLFCNWDREPDPQHMFINCIFEDNAVLYSGNHPFADQTYDAAFSSQAGPNLQENSAIRNNIFILGASALVYIEDYIQDNLPKFAGNAYIHTNDGHLLRTQQLDDQHVIYGQGDANIAIRQMLGDYTGRVITIE